MKKFQYQFAVKERNSYRLTPLGAAVVEALPDRRRVAEIKRRFRKDGTCPCSLVFPTPEAIADFEATCRS